MYQLQINYFMIDGTNEYIKGHLTNPVNHIHDNGLQVSVVLIGIHDIISGAPVMGIVNQPFHVTDDYNNWKGRVIWGVATNQCKVACVPGRIIRGSDTLIIESSVTNYYYNYCRPSITRSVFNRSC